MSASSIRKCAARDRTCFAAASWVNVPTGSSTPASLSILMAMNDLSHSFSALVITELTAMNTCGFQIKCLTNIGVRVISFGHSTAPSRTDVISQPSPRCSTLPSLPSVGAACRIGRRGGRRAPQRSRWYEQAPSRLPRETRSCTQRPNLESSNEIRARLRPRPSAAGTPPPQQLCLIPTCIMAQHSQPHSTTMAPQSAPSRRTAPGAFPACQCADMPDRSRHRPYARWLA